MMMMVRDTGIASEMLN